jgi:SAM-dependent methyltransferase
MGAHQASLFRQWSDDVTLVIHAGAPPDSLERQQLTSRGVRIVEGPVEEIVVADDRLTGVRLQDGTAVPAAAVVVSPRLVARAELAAALGVEVVEAPLGLGTMIAADGTGATAAPGVFVAGNVADVRAHVLQSAAGGASAGAAINADLIAEDTARAVEADRRSRGERPVMDAAFWEDRYGSKPFVWSGNPNPHLVTDTATLVPGTALDVGAGEGADAIWLAEQGWDVTAVDISTIALARGRRRAEEVGAAERITWLHADLTTWQPPTRAFDLVSVHFLQLPPDERHAVYSGIAGAVAPGGTLLIVGHHPTDMDAGVGRPHWPEMYFTAEELAAGLGQGWSIISADARSRQIAGPDGDAATIRDAVLVARRSELEPSPPGGEHLDR